MKPDMVSCHEALALIYEFLDGELDGPVTEQVKAHFDICGHCYPKLRLEESFRAAVRKAAQGQAPPPDLKERLLIVLAEAERSGAS